MKHVRILHGGRAVEGTLDGELIQGPATKGLARVEG